ncbi:GTPase Obg [Rhodnius prolixus]
MKAIRILWAISPSLRYCTSTSQPLRNLKRKSTSKIVKHFVDSKRVTAEGGKGGDGCVSFLQLWANENAGPDGGDGGHGGHVILQASTNERDLNNVQTILRANHGDKGRNKDCHGANADHLVVKVPVGTVIRDNHGRTVGDLCEDGSMFILARGGAGGRGNHFFATDLMQSPKIAEYGATGEHISYILEVKSMAHFGLLGLPNAGKSTLLQAISRARPKVAPYPFTTLKPFLGVINYSDFEQIAVADLPGLIEGSHLNYGLGIQFLKHAERCSCLLMVLDTSNDPCYDLEILRTELKAFSIDLANKKQIIIANKMDLEESKVNLPILKKFTKDDNIIPISAKFGLNITSFLVHIRKVYDSLLNKQPDDNVGIVK